MTDRTRNRAGFGARLGAWFLDGLLYGLLQVAFIGVGVGLIVAGAKDCIDKIDFDTQNEVTCTSSEVNGALVFAGICVIALGVLLVAIIYVRALGRTGQTWGRRIVGVRVVDQHTLQPIGFGRALGRSVFAILISNAIFYLGYLWMLWDREQQTWHDKVVGSIVIDA
ncbi:MAG: RDD family protein [Actinomycetota bacterium]